MEKNDESKLEIKDESKNEKKTEKNEESIQVDEIKTKSDFEKKLIQAFKETKIIKCHDSLSQAYLELDKYIEQIKNQKNSSFLLNSNILDKLNRLSKRNYININILLSEIVYTLLDSANFSILSDDSHILINFLNLCINVLELIDLYELSNNLTKRIIKFLKYLESNSVKYLDAEQLEIIKNIQKTLNEKIISNDYIAFKNNYKNDILSFFSSDNLRDKEKGLFDFYSYFFKLGTLNEQFEFFNEFGQTMLNSIINNPNPSFVELYYKTADLISSFLYNFYYIIKKGDKNEINSNNYFLCDNMNIDINDSNAVGLVNFQNIYNYENLAFLDKKKFELVQKKNILLDYTNLISICITLVKCLIMYESSFNCQYAAFFLLKRLYFIFPKYRNNIEDLLVNNLVYLVSFKSEIINNKNEPCEKFLKFLLQNGEKELKEKLITKLNEQKEKIEKNYLDENNVDNISQDEVEYDYISLNNFDLRVGCPMNIEINAGYTSEKLVEIKYPNSLFYIAFNTVGLNIDFHLVKFCPNLENDVNILQNRQFEQHQYFYEVFKIAKSEGCRIVLFVKNPGIYMIVFDNKFSWFNSKLIRYKIAVLKEIKDGEEIKYGEEIKNENDIKDKEDNNNINEKKNNNVAFKEKEDSKIEIIL